MGKVKVRVIAPEENAEVQRQARQDKIELAAMLVLAGAEIWALVQMVRLVMAIEQVSWLL